MRLLIWKLFFKQTRKDGLCSGLEKEIAQDSVLSECMDDTVN